MRQRHQEVSRAHFILKSMVVVSPLVVAVAVFIALRQVLSPALLQLVVFGSAIMDAAALLLVVRMVGRKLNRLDMDYRMEQVEEYVISDLRQARFPRGLRLDFASLKRACVAFLETTPEGTQKGLKSVSFSVSFLSDLSPLRVTCLPRSRIVLKIEKAT